MQASSRHVSHGQDGDIGSVYSLEGAISQQSGSQSLLYGSQVINKVSLILTGTVPRGVHVLYDVELNHIIREGKHGDIWQSRQKSFLEVLGITGTRKSKGIIYETA